MLRKEKEQNDKSSGHQSAAELRSKASANRLIVPNDENASQQDKDDLEELARMRKGVSGSRLSALS